MKNTSEQLLSFAENELMEKESIRRAVLREAAQKQKQPVAWTKILLPIAACLVLALGTVFLIPSARAEVLRWLRIERPEQYLTEDPEERTPVEALDELNIWYCGGRNAPYIWMRCPNGMGSWEFFDLLLEKVQVVGTPGEGFGACGEGFFRFSTFGSRTDTIEAARRLVGLLG